MADVIQNAYLPPQHLINAQMRSLAATDPSRRAAQAPSARAEYPELDGGDPPPAYDGPADDGQPPNYDGGHRS